VRLFITIIAMVQWRWTDIKTEDNWWFFFYSSGYNPMYINN